MTKKPKRALTRAPLHTHSEGEEEIELLPDQGDPSPMDILLAGVEDAPPVPVIIDPTDGLPRPADDGVTLTTVPPATDENLVCMEGGAWVPEGPGVSEPSSPPVLVAFVEGQRLYEDPHTKRRYVRARPQCEHYVEQETEVTELDLSGFPEGVRPRTILRHCSQLGITLTDSVLRGCTARSPRDVVSESRLVEHARKKADEARAGSVPLFRSAPAVVEVSVDTSASTVKATSYSYASEKDEALPPEHRRPDMIVFHPSATPEEIIRVCPKLIVFPDAIWQPRSELFVGREVQLPDGKPYVWSASLSGELIARMEFAESELAEGKPLPAGMRGIRYTLNVKAIVNAIARGRTVAIVPFHRSTQDRLVADCQAAFEALSRENSESETP